MGDKLLFTILFFIIMFIVVYFVYYMIFDDMLKKEKYTKISELMLITNKFKVDKKKMDYKKCLNGIALINAFIMSLTMAVVDLIGLKSIIWLPIALIMIFGLIIIMYYTYGKMCEKKWGK